jgi:lysophospholipase L1-like esterase
MGVTPFILSTIASIVASTLSSGKYLFASSLGGSFYERYNSGTTQTLIASRARHIIGSGDRSKLRVVIPNWAFSTGPNTLPANIVRCALECNGVSVPVTFSGSRSVSIPVSSNTATAKFESDDILPLSFGLPKFTRGSEVFIRMEASAVPSINRVIMMYRYDKSSANRAVQYNPSNTSVNIDSIGALTVTGSDFIEWTAGNTTEIAAGLVGPFVGADQPVWGALGDSIATGDSDFGPLADDISGFVQRSMFDVDLVSNPVALLKMTIAGYKLSQVVSLINQFSAWFPYATHWFEELGTNDITAVAGTTSLSVMQSNKLTVWNTLRSAGAQRIYTMDYLPRTTGSYATEAAQTVVSSDYNIGGLTDQLSSWFTTKVSDGTLNGKLRLVAPYGINPYVWSPSATSDGLHPNQSMHIQMAAEMRTWRSGLS